MRAKPGCGSPTRRLAVRPSAEYGRTRAVPLHGALCIAKVDSHAGCAGGRARRLTCPCPGTLQIERCFPYRRQRARCRSRGFIGKTVRQGEGAQKKVLISASTICVGFCWRTPARYTVDAVARSARIGNLGARHLESFVDVRDDQRQPADHDSRSLCSTLAVVSLDFRGIMTRRLQAR